MKINQGCYVTVLSGLYNNKHDAFSDTDSNIVYDLETDTPCDRSDLAGLNIDYQNGNLNYLMDITQSHHTFTHIVEDSDGFVFAIRID